MNPNKSIPSMFHRRLVLLAAVFALIAIALTGQMVRLSVVEGAERLRAAEEKLDRFSLLATTRGSIIDRNGKLLALDRASDNVAVEYDVIIGAWPRRQAAAQAKDEIGRTRWNSMGPEERDAAIAARLPGWQARVETMWADLCQVGGISRDELEQRINRIKADVQSTAAAVWERDRLAEIDRFGTSDADFKVQPIREQSEPHVILSQVDPETALKFKRLAQQYGDMFEVQDARRREYPWLAGEVTLARSSLPLQIRRNEPVTIRVEGVADHILGAMRDRVWAEDVQRRPFKHADGTTDLGGYRPGDSVGARGLEIAFEDHLRGLRGEVRERKSPQAPTNAIGDPDIGAQQRTEPVPGGDLHVTLDIELQARVQAILYREYGLTVVQPWHNNPSLTLGTPLNAAAVVLEVETGEILAMVSMPTIAMGELMAAEERERNQAQVHRPAEAIYPPGSIIKPFVLVAAVKEGLHDLAAAIKCTGYYFESLQDKARCWIYRDKYGFVTHGDLRAEEALARSCNIFFYTLGDRLGMTRLRDWLRRFGLGTALDIGLAYDLKTKEGKIIRAGESTGDLPGDELIARWRSAGGLKFRETIMGIGQGPITWTPLQAANAYATLARGGVIRDATLVANDPRRAAGLHKRTPDLNLSQSLVNAVLEGLRQSVEEDHGTGNHITHLTGPVAKEPIINAEGVTVWAKTGTAEANKTLHLDHAWFVGLVGPKRGRPLYSIAVIIENGGSGGRAAGPVANQIIRALQAEGYLPGDADAPAPLPNDAAPASAAESEAAGADDGGHE